VVEAVARGRHLRRRPRLPRERAGDLALARLLRAARSSPCPPRDDLQLAMLAANPPDGAAPARAVRDARARRLVIQNAANSGVGGGGRVARARGVRTVSGAPRERGRAGARARRRRGDREGPQLTERVHAAIPRRGGDPGALRSGSTRWGAGDGRMMRTLARAARR
jgi:hypothetical protein